MSDQNHPHHRPIRSYVLREGRMTEAQHRAYDELYSQYGITFDPKTQLNTDEIFANTQPVTLEIGFGNGDALWQTAAAHPQNNYIGIEVHRPGVGHLLLELQQHQLTNVRVIRHDAMEVLRFGLETGSLSGLNLFFADPWPKKKHHKRRIVQTEFIQLAANAIRPGGLLHMATDWTDYAHHMMAVMAESPAFQNLAANGKNVPRPDGRPLTRFEQRGTRLGHEVWDLMYQRI